MKRMTGAIAPLAILVAVAVPGTAVAQRADQNLVTGSDDAFGTSVGTETVGIYSEYDTRGFSPIDAGNARIDGIYYDPIGITLIALKESTTIRVGTAADGFPFNAPTGIVDHKFRPLPEEYGFTGGAQYGAYGGFLVDGVAMLPLVKDKVGVSGGFAAGKIYSGDGSNSLSIATGIRPVFRFGGVEVAPFYGNATFFENYAHVLVVPVGPDLPKVPESKKYLGQDWEEGRYRYDHMGTTIKARLTENLSFRGGIFRSTEHRRRNFSDIFYITGPEGQARHELIADPLRKRRATSGEAIIALKLGNTGWTHRIFAGYRERDRLTETGGSDIIDFGQAIYGEPDPQEKPDFEFSDTSVGRLKQTSLMLGYIGGQEGVAKLNLGIQKARYRAQFRDGLTGLVDRSRADPWLYNAIATVNITPSLSAYAGTERGLEDRGTAPDRATNRSEQLPATLATQYEGGLRWQFPAGVLVLNAFQITKPYFSYDATRRFVELGDERHRGVETSLSAKFGDLSVLAGVVAMKREVKGAAVEAGLIGRLPTGTPAIRGRLDLNYETAIFGGLTPTATIVYKGRQAVGSRPLAALGGEQLMLPAFATLDLGLRQQFTVEGVTARIRVAVDNVLDEKAWKVAAADTLFPEERRRFTVSLRTNF